MSLMFRNKAVKASSVVRQPYRINHYYHPARILSSNLALAHEQEIPPWSPEQFLGLKARKIPPLNGRPSSYFKEPLPEFVPSDEKLKKARKSFAGGSEMPYIQYGKSDIKVLFEHYAPHLNTKHYIAAAEVFAPRTNNYVIENHINWSNVPNDPMFKMLFPQPEMLSRRNFHDVLNAMDTMTPLELRDECYRIHETLNPNPAGQKTMNVPMMDGEEVKGIQHKYGETMLFFPKECQFCHAYCTYCFRWQQFTSVGSDKQFNSKDAAGLLKYVKRHKHIKDLLITGGDSMVARAEVLAKYIEPLLNNPETEHLQTIRFGTKSLAFWPYKFTTDDDATPMLDLFKRIRASGKHVSIQAHFSHPIELKTKVVKEAIKNIQETGAVIRTQSPIIRGINDSAECWEEMWNLQTQLGLVPYYTFIERDTGASEYFRVPLHRALDIFHTALKKVPGTARTVRGPSMSAGPGKVHVLGVSEVGPEGHKEKVFALRFIQARNPNWCDADKVFYAKYDEKAYWLTDLKPAFGAKEWFWEAEYQEMAESKAQGSSGQRSHWT